MTRGAAPVRHGSRARSQSIGRILAVAVAAALGFAIVFAQSLASSVSASITAADIDSLVSTSPDTPVEHTDGQPLNLLLMGSDVRTGENGDIGGRVADGMRNDTTIIVHLSGDRERAQIVSIPRDLQVEISDCTLYDGTRVGGGYGDFNVAFSNGGSGGDAAEAAACVINTVHDQFDLRIDHFAVVDFTGFIDMVDALGGIPMCVPERIVSSKAHLDLEPGPQVFDGVTALNYARLRTAEVGDVSGSDLQRIQRQQQLLEQTVRTARSQNLFADAAAVTRFVRAGAESLTTDDELGSLSYLGALAYDLRGLRPEDLTFATIPWEYTDDRLNVVMTADAELMLDDLRHDRPLSVAAQGDSTSEWDDGLAEPTEEATATPAPDAASDDAADAGEPESVEDILALCRN
ncbi:LCP family protein [Demequina activiva]|uniref:Transcriptional regulator n=1 Tax=Demequina activiva TaxID=1582364 RepID=A0A919Q725_9MICO|nr:LCP family protein [Demequina activiva]GIG55383.1 transcriptional regulator [Demequina activiva]